MYDTNTYPPGRCEHPVDVQRCMLTKLTYMIGKMQMDPNGFCERGYATDGGCHSRCEEEWTERRSIFSDVYSKTASQDGTTATVIRRGSACLYSILLDSRRGCTLDAFCTARRLV